MIQTEERVLEERTLPSKIDSYEIDSAGVVRQSFGREADVYIRECDVRYFRDRETMLHILDQFGPRIGVMRDTRYPVRSREYKTPKRLLGVVRKNSQQEVR